MPKAVADGSASFLMVRRYSPAAQAAVKADHRYILEADLLEGIIALPTDMFYNTGIATYVWVLSNKKRQNAKVKSS